MTATSSNDAPPAANELLAARPVRATHPGDVRRAIAMIGEATAGSPDAVLQALAEHALDLCRAGSAGVSVEERGPDGALRFRWRACAGQLAPYLGGTMPRHFSPCGIVLDQAEPQLMVEPVRYYPYIAELPHIHEVLLVPVASRGAIRATLWVCSHEPHVVFDRADLETLVRLARHVGTVLDRMPAGEDSFPA